MNTEEWRLAFITELHRVLVGSAVSTHFYEVGDTASEDQLRELTKWLAEQLAGLGEDELARRLQSEPPHV